ncbi:hypothetical protein [Helicobacter heilmannii]|uniref:Uncharacterized protein n=1 Tax=Helicobacter heilmannii TaxID=35817 RepID=A0A0K2Y488_HELHE|nr:hypothetical protein [Helicobacter heilmannii]BDQ27845.1 hypothetical protein ASB1_15210 [Helicobacter heilmannii]CCM10996.1 hypothetical protein BN341_17630 [Helicobacter heilmannii ASB1.4]CRI33618.1 hypothetical protein HHE01_08220 [Helicobacter heilmannii]
MQDSLDQDKISKLARTALDQVPLFQTFKATNKHQRDFLEQVKIFESMHLLSMMSDAPASQIATNFLEFLNFFYKPLFEAIKGGLKIDAYLRHLQKNLVCKRAYKDCYYVLENYASSMEYYASFNPGGISKDLIRDVNDLYEVSSDFLSISVTWLKVYIASMLDDDAGRMQERGDFKKDLFNQAPLAPLKDILYLYTARILQVIKDIDAYVDLQDITPEILQQRPTICLNPNYLNPALQKECQTLLAKPQPALKAQLEVLRAFFMDNSPCVALDANQQPLFFHTKDAFCQALQTNLKKEF